MAAATKPELLAPAGDWEALRAACANGADAVYFGLSNFNARARAANFELDELPEVMRFLHARNVKGFVTLNTLIFSDELPDVADFVEKIAEAGVDAVIVQDVGLVRLIRMMAPSLHVHASTQMTLTEPKGIAAAKRLGIDRVVLARELSLDDIRKVTASTDMPVEVFVHGALCVAYSGQCLTSEALGGRSANRGQCAQACRLPYEMIVDGRAKELGDKAYLLSPQDLAAYSIIDDLIDAGVISFKIEGRLKGGPYVAATTQTYRHAIDAALVHKPFEPTRQEELDLAQTFSRGLTHGFLDGVNHQMLVRGRFPKSRGVKLGTVTGTTRQGIVVELAESVPDVIKPGDGVLFDLGTPEVQEPAGRVWEVRNTSVGKRVELLFGRDAINFSAIPIGTTVWKTDDPALKKRLEQSYSQDKPARRIPIRAKLSGLLGETVTLFLQDGERTSQAVWPGPLETARTRPTSVDDLRDALSRLGDTPFELGDLSVELPANVLIPKSVLNDLRRQAVAELLAKRTATQRHAIVEPNALSVLRSGFPIPHSEFRTLNYSVLCRNLDQLDAVLKRRPAMVYCDFEDLRRYGEAVSRAKAAGVPVGLATLRILKPGEDGFQSMIVRANPDAVLVRNLASLDYFKAALPRATLIGDYSLNIANELTADYFVREGCERIVPSFDLNWEQFAALLKRFDPSRFEPVVHQHMPMFHMEHCVFAAFLSTGKDHRDCGRPCDVHRVELKDRVGSHFPVHPDTGCRNTVFNSVPQSAAEYLPRMLALGVRTVRIDLLRETADEIGPLLDGYEAILAGRDDGRGTWRNLRAINQLGVTRGTLNLV
jgi:putative protease